MLVFPLILPPSVAKLTGVVSSGVAVAVLGRFARRSDSATVRTDAAGDGEGRSQGAEVRSRATDTVPMSPAPLRRMRARRLSPQPRVADLTPDDEASLVAANEFADRLAALPLHVWLDVGRSLVDDASIHARRATPFAILEATLSDRGLAVAAWYVRDAIDTSAHYAASAMTRWTKQDRLNFAAARAVAQETALALLARPHLSAEDYLALCAPFEALC